ncbi:MAG: hypothetical protein ACRENT_00400 [Thermodesulfobacteriota bacterium]
MFLTTALRMAKKTIENPWINLRQSPPYILEEDRAAVEAFNKEIRKSLKREYLIIPRSLPEPFIGNPHTATIVFLSLNPGHKRADLKWHRKRIFKMAVRSNLRHDKTKYPFYPLDPKFEQSPVAIWWKKCLKGLLKEVNDDALVASKVCVIEWFPYHSVRAKLGAFQKRHLFSQLYSFDLACNASRDKTKLVVVMRACKIWEQLVGSLTGAIRLKNYRRLSVSSGNLHPGDFEMLLKAIR